jgi:hypothetical protein
MIGARSGAALVLPAQYAAVDGLVAPVYGDGLQLDVML